MCCGECIVQKRKAVLHQGDYIHGSEVVDGEIDGHIVMREMSCKGSETEDLYSNKSDHMDYEAITVDCEMVYGGERDNSVNICSTVCLGNLGNVLSGTFT